MPQPQTSIWGTILTCVEIGLHIYALQAEARPRDCPGC